MIINSGVGGMVAHFKMLTKEFPIRTEQNKERLSFLVKVEKRDTGIQNEHSGIFSSGACRTSEGSVAYLYLSVRIFHFDSVDCMS